MSIANSQTQFWALIGMLIAASSAMAQEPDLDVLVQTAEQTADQLPQRSASWTSVTRLAKDLHVDVEVLSTPSMRRKAITFHQANRQLGAFQVIERDGLWYVAEPERRAKYRPFEATFQLDVTYLFLARSELHLAAREFVDTAGQHKETKDGVATFVVPPDDAQRRQIEYAIDQSEKLWQRQPKSRTPDSLKRVEELQAMLQGATVRVDLATGIVVQYGVPERQTEIHDFQWRDQIDPELFAIQQHEWEDFSDDPTAGDLDELAMIRHNVNWRPERKSSEGETCLLHLGTGQLRRVPFAGISALPGCFLKDRKRVVITGLDEISGSMGAYEVHLSTGENRRLGGERLATGNSLMPALSPDGKTIAIFHKEPQGGILDQQLYLVDVDSGDARPLGRPQDMAFLSWLPDGQHLVVVIRTQPDPMGRQSRSISLLDMDGKSTPLCDGDMPLLLNDGKTILFRTTDNQGWRTYDLQDKQHRPFANGMKGYGFPSAGPDGTSLLWISWAHGNSPVPEIVPIGENSGKVVTRTPGLWNLPAWR